MRKLILYTMYNYINTEEGPDRCSDQEWNVDILEWLLKKKIMTSGQIFASTHMGDWKKRTKTLWPDDIKIKFFWPSYQTIVLVCFLFGLIHKETHHSHYDAWWWQQHAVGIVHCSRPYMACAIQINTAKQRIGINSGEKLSAVCMTTATWG